MRSYAGYHAISTRRHDSSDDDYDVAAADAADPAKARAFEMPELMHNINMLIDMTEEEIITRDRQLRWQRNASYN